jgi:preprotein translocase subunit SecE
MGEIANTTTEKAPRRNWFKGIKSEFKKIVWLDKESLVKQSVAVISVTIALGIVIYVLDLVVERIIAFLL